MQIWQRFFKDKKVTQMGLGLLGRGVGNALFLARMGTDVLVTDLKVEKELAPSVMRLKKFENIKFHLGGHKLKDFRDRDFILKAAGVPLDSPYIAEARKNKIPVEMDASLFFKLMPESVTFIGVTGTRGKTTTAYLIFEILEEFVAVGLLQKCSSPTALKPRVFLAGNIKDTATLPLLEKVRPGDFVVAELDSWQLQGFGDSKLSPHIAVFTTFLPDHMNYYKGDMGRYFQDKANIFKFQKKGNVLILGEQVEKIARRNLAAQGFAFKNLKSKKIIARGSDLPFDWKLKIIGEHNRANAACALAAARALKIPDEISRKAMENFKGVTGRLEFIREIRGVKIYNDNNATTPDATIAALRALNSKFQAPNSKQIPISKSQTDKKIILICGGTDKGLDMSGLIAEIPKHCKAVVCLKETGTEKLISNFQFPRLPIGGQAISNQFSIFQEETLRQCVREAMRVAGKGDTILFSPAFASFGKWFKNEYDRGERFVKLVENL